MKLPFRFMPGSWGLVGKTRARAEAEYYYSGEELARVLANIDNDTENDRIIALLKVDLKYNKITQREFDKKVAENINYDTENDRIIALLKVDLKYNKITQQEFDKKVVENTEYEDDDEKEIAFLEIQHKYNKISDNEFEKQKATIKKERYINISKVDIDPNDPKIGFFELDWNEYFIEYLSKHGYKMTKPEIMVNTWLNDIHRTNLLQESNDLDFGLTDTDRNTRPDVQIINNPDVPFPRMNDDEDEHGTDSESGEK